ncbi:MAG: twin-arginine translocase TatA/TatE family subunit [Nitrospinae bacterium]|nr:twin-arginine translocase TatA/TatE family subunit [Nitrospinota bacterium]
MMGIGFPELMVILVIIMIIFGAGKLPEIGSAFGRSIKNFKTSMKEAEEASGDQTAQVEGGDAAPDADLNAEDAPASTEEEVTAQLAGSHPSAAPPSESTATPASGSSKPAAPTQTAQAQAPQGKPKPKETPKSEEEKMIEDAINELKEKRIGTIRTPHDGLVQQNDVFTDSLKRNPWGRRGDRGVRRDVL